MAFRVEIAGHLRTLWGQPLGRLSVARLGQPARPAQRAAPPGLSAAVQQQLDLALQETPEKFGLHRTRWDGVLVVEYLRRFHHVELKVRQAQRYVRRLGFTLQMPIYRYLQARKKGVAAFQRAVKKNSAKR